MVDKNTEKSGNTSTGSDSDDVESLSAGEGESVFIGSEVKDVAVEPEVVADSSSTFSSGFDSSFEDSLNTSSPVADFEVPAERSSAFAGRSQAPTTPPLGVATARPNLAGSAFASKLQTIPEVSPLDVATARPNLAGSAFAKRLESLEGLNKQSSSAFGKVPNPLGSVTQSAGSVATYSVNSAAKQVSTPLQETQGSASTAGMGQ